MKMWRAAQDVGNKRKGSRNGSKKNNRHPLTQRTYVLRSFVSCALCGDRMAGKLQRRHVYYNCEPRKNLGPKWSDLFPEHPTSIYVREDRLVGGTLEYMQERVFGPKRKKLVEAELKDSTKAV